MVKTRYVKHVGLTAKLKVSITKKKKKKKEKRKEKRKKRKKRKKDSVSFCKMNLIFSKIKQRTEYTD